MVVDKARVPPHLNPLPEGEDLKTGHLFKKAKRKMKVTAVTTLPVSRFNYVKVETDEGINGVGELHPAFGTGGTPFVPRAAVEYCAEYLVGKDPFTSSGTGSTCPVANCSGGGSDMMAAIGAIDIALWDIKGKSLGKPVYELLGGLTR